MTFSIDNPEGGCNNPPSENMFGKNPQLRITRVNEVHSEHVGFCHANEPRSSRYGSLH